MSKSSSADMRVQLGELERKLKRVAAAVQREALAAALETGAQIVAEAANAKAPGPNIAVERDPKLTDTLASVSVGPVKRKWYYQFAEVGTTRHEIRPRRRRQLKALRFEGSEGAVFARIVNHPGTPARPFLRPAIRENEERVAAAVGEALRAKIEEAS